MTDNARYGVDLRLLGDLRRQSDRTGGSDLEVATRPLTGQRDLLPVSDVDNLCQALLLRLMTRQGELTALGHPDYGSRLYTLIGEPNTAANRNRAKLYALQALSAEPRVASIVSLEVSSGARDRIDINATLLAIHADTPVNLVFPFFLGGQ